MLKIECKSGCASSVGMAARAGQTAAASLASATLTQHARKRMQQRGISAEALHWLLEFGRRRHDRHGGQIVFLDHSARRRLQQAGPAPRLQERLEDIYAVTDATGCVITVGHRFLRLPHA